MMHAGQLKRWSNCSTVHLQPQRLMNTCDVTTVCSHAAASSTPAAEPAASDSPPSLCCSYAYEGTIHLSSSSMLTAGSSMVSSLSKTHHSFPMSEDDNPTRVSTRALKPLYCTCWHPGCCA